MFKIKNNSISYVILTIVVGFLSGLLGCLFLGQNNFSLPFLGRVNFNNVDRDRQIVIDQPRNVVVEQDLQLKQVENDLFPALVNIYSSKNSSGVVGQVYLPSEILGQGFVLTADGWVVTTKDVATSLKAKYAVIGYQLKKYQIDNFIADERTGLVFGKMPANSLTVAKIGRSKELIQGQTLAVISQRGQVSLTHVQKIAYNPKSVQDLIQSSEAFDKRILLEGDFSSKDYNGAVVVSLKGEIVGVMIDGLAVPSDYFQNVISQVLDKQQISRPILGIKYFDLAQTEGLVEFGDKGALVYGNPAKDSPAFGQLMDGDVIKKINDIELNYFQSLSEVINGYKSGDKIELLVQRSNQEKSIEVVLK